MQTLNAVLYQGDPALTRKLVACMCKSFHSIHAARSLDDLRISVAKRHAQVAVVDMEMTPLSEVELLCHDFPSLSVVCTHRLADEEMWKSALNAGAVDICPSADTQGIVTAALRNLAMQRSAAA